MNRIKKLSLEELITRIKAEVGQSHDFFNGQGISTSREFLLKNIPESTPAEINEAVFELRDRQEVTIPDGYSGTPGVILILPAFRQ